MHSYEFLGGAQWAAVTVIKSLVGEAPRQLWSRKPPEKVDENRSRDRLGTRYSILAPPPNNSLFIGNRHREKVLS